MSAEEYRITVLKFKEKFGETIIEQVERNLNRDFDEALRDNPRLVLERMIRIVYRQYILPFEVVKSINSFLLEKFQISKWKLALSEEYIFNPYSDPNEISSFLSSFYAMTNRMGINPKRISTGEDHE